MKVRVRFSLRLFLLLTLLCAAVMAWFGVNYIQRFRHDAIVADRFVRAGGQVERTPRPPQWFWALFGNDVSQRSSSLMLSDKNSEEAPLAEVEQLVDLEGLYLDDTKIADQDISRIGGLINLVALTLRRTNVSTLPPLARLHRLTHLDLAFTQIDEIDTDGLTSLEYLNLRGTHINDAILAGMSTLPKLQTLDIAGAPGRSMKITDRGVAYLSLAKLPKLRRLYLYETAVTDAGEQRLKAEFPGLAVYRQPPGVEKVSQPPTSQRNTATGRR